jgi:hypothetical protein
MLLARGCPLDAFPYLVLYEDPEKLLKFVERREANDDEFRLGTFQFDATTAWVDKLLRKWDLAQLPNDALFIAIRYNGCLSPKEFSQYECGRIG